MHFSHPDKLKGSSTKQSSFLSGVMILTVSNLLVKVAGLLFKVPMNYIVGDAGMGYYNSAYSVYTLFYMLSTSGLPVALSVMVSERRSRGNTEAAKLIYRLALTIFFIIGLAVCLVMLIFPNALAELIKSDRSALSIAVAAPTMLFICISSAVRGYFQGCGNMVPTAVSQLIEAVGKLVLGVAAASYAIKMGYSVHIVAAYGVAGLTLGSFAGMVYLLFAKFLRRDRDLAVDCGERTNDSLQKRDILRRFVRISLPITVSASVMSLTNMIDTALIQRILQSSGMSEEAAATLYGNYTSLAVPMFNLPPVLVYPIAYALVPSVAAAFASGNRTAAAERIESCIRYAVIIGLPCAMGLSTLADPILCLLYKEASAHMAAPLLTCLAPSSFFVCILAVTNSTLQACGQERKPVISMLAGAVVKCVFSVILLRKLGIIGAPLSTFACYLTVTAINLGYVAKYTGIRLELAKTLLRPLAGSVLCSIVGVILCRLLVYHIGIRLSCLIAILAAAVVYGMFIVLSGAVGRDEITELCQRIIKKKGNKNLGNKRAQA